MGDTRARNLPVTSSETIGHDPRSAYVDDSGSGVLDPSSACDLERLAGRSANDQLFRHSTPTRAATAATTVAIADALSTPATAVTSTATTRTATVAGTALRQTPPGAPTLFLCKGLSFGSVLTAPG